MSQSEWTEIEQVFKKKLGIPQINFLRHILFDHIKYDLLTNYSLAATQIEQYTGTSISEDTVQRFATNDNPDNEGSDFYSSHRSQKLFALYLSHDEVDCLKAEELHEAQHSFRQIPERLSVFFETEEPLLGRGYLGSYRGTSISSGLQSYIQLASVEGRSYLTAIEYVFETSGDGETHESVREDDTKMRYAGWGVFVKRDMLVLMLKDPVFGRSKCYFSLGQPEFYQGTSRLHRMLVSSHENITELGFSEGALRFEKKLISDAKRKVIEYQRDDEFSGFKF